MPSRVTVNYADQTGQKATEQFNFSGIKLPADMPALRDALDGVSNAAITGMRITATAMSAGAAAEEGDYDTAADKATLEFAGPGGNLVRITVPAPDEAAFLPDKETLDVSAGVGKDMMDAVIANAKDPNGGALTYLRGYRERTGRKTL